MNPFGNNVGGGRGGFGLISFAAVTVVRSCVSGVLGMVSKTFLSEQWQTHLEGTACG